MAQVLTKRDAFALFESGSLGTKMKFFPSVESYLTANHKGPVVMRQCGRPGGKCNYHVPEADFQMEVSRWLNDGVPLAEIVVHEMTLDDSRITIQGEIMRSQEYVSLRYSLEPLKMRDALKAKQLHTYGLKAILILRHFLSPASYENLMGLFDTYPDSVIEFSTWDSDLGDQPNQNTIVWEVRNY